MVRKRLTFLKTLIAAVAVILLFTACEQFLKDPEDFLSYWASEAFVKDHSIGSAVRPDGAGVPCVDSSKNVIIMLTVHNPKGFSFVLPTVSESAGIVEFKELFEQPEVETHYDLERTASGRLKLTYKEAFLQEYEQGSGSLNPTITLKATDGRVFKKTYTFGIKSNTPPPEPAVVLAKQTNAYPLPSYYVLCIDTKDLVASSAIVNGKYIHDDIAYVTINGTSYNLKMNNAHNGFIEKPATESFLENGTGLMAVGSAQLPTASPWVLYYKTNIKIRDSNPLTTYRITLRDKEGVVSDEAVATIAASGPTHTVTFSVEGGTGMLKAEVNGTEIHSGYDVEKGKTVTFTATPAEGWEVEKWTHNGSPVNGTRKTYRIDNITDDATVTVTFKKVWTVKFRVADGEGELEGSYDDGLHYSQTAKKDGVEVKLENVPEGTQVSFAATPADGWKVKAWTLDGYNVSGEQENYGPDPITADITVTVEFEKVAAVAGTDNFAWKLLKKAVEIADPNAVITINGEIKASGPSEGDCGEIVINGKSLTIKKADGAASAVLDANGLSRIFKVENGANLILENLTLTGGKATGTGDADSGGAIYAKNASTVNIENCIITGNEADTNGGGIYVEGTPTTITNCIFTGNTAKNGGGIYIIQGDRIPVVTISGGTIGGTGTGEANKATGSDGNGGGIYVGDRCKVILQNNDSTGCTIKGNTAQLGGGVYAANKADVSMKGGTQIAVDNDVYLYSGSAILVYNALATAGTVARITVPKDDYKSSTKVLYGDAVGSEHAKFAVTPKGNEHWTVDSNGYLTNNKTDIFNNITKDQIKAAIDAAIAAASSMIYGENATIDHMALDGRLVLYETKWSGHTNYGIMHVTEVNNSGGGYIKFNYKTFRAYNDSVQQEDAKKVNGGTKFDLDTGNVNVNGSDFSLENTGQKRFKVLDNAKFYILPN